MAIRSVGAPRTLCLLAAIAALVLGATPAFSEDADSAPPPVSFSFMTDIWSGYWYRGMTTTDRITAQPSGAVSFGSTGLQVGFWSSYALADRDRLRFADEVDLILNYSRPFSWAGQTGSICLGYTEYFFTAFGGAASRTGEVILCAAMEYALAPVLTAYYDVDLFDEAYVEASIAPEIALGSADAPAAVMTARLGAGEYGEPFGLRNAEVSAGLRFRIGSIALTPHLGYGYAVAGPEEGESQFLGGVSAAFGE